VEVVGAAYQVPRDAAVDQPAGEAFLVDPGVVVTAQESGVVQVGGPAVGPVNEVMRFSVSACPIERNAHDGDAVERALDAEE